MREQNIKTGAARRWLSALAAAILTLSLAATTIYMFQYKQPYKPPPFEPEAIVGAPEPPKDFGYSEIDASGSFRFGIAGVMYQQEDGSLRVYFNNPEENKAYLMCEVADISGNTLYKSGLLRPGEYVVSLNPVKTLENVAVKIEVKIYAFDPKQYYSVGTVTLDNILQPY
jgi:acylphosphatase